ncbi:hypothetical protein ES703_95447 [subsurface metagenome]
MSWASLRKEALRNVNKECSLCGAVENLHVHHIRYPARNLNDVLVVCPICHFKLHGKCWKRKGYVKWDKEELKQLIEKNKTLREMSELFQISHERIRQKLSDWNLKTSYKHNIGRVKRKQIRLKKERVREVEERAKKEGCSFSNMIQRILEEYFGMVKMARDR